MLPGTNQNPCQDMFACIVGILYKLMCPYIRAMPTVSFALLLLLLLACCFCFSIYLLCFCFCFLLLRCASVFFTSAFASCACFCCKCYCKRGLCLLLRCLPWPGSTERVLLQAASFQYYAGCSRDPVLLQVASFQRCPSSLEEEGVSPTAQTFSVPL